ncbi:MAG: GNAT family N-acetyltransferase [Clostridia bacterium]|nr:GNAT family N-acetyltransferase [Clostridia bacterium]
MKNKVTAIFRNPPVLFTERLYLRKMERFDSEDMFEYASLPQTTEYLLWEPHPDINYTRKYLTLVQNKYKCCEFFDWAICLKDTKKMIGTCGFTRIDERNLTGEIGYVINPKYCGNGYATEAAKRVLRFGFEELQLRRIEARYMLPNDASLRIMKKSGMKEEGVLRNALLKNGKEVSVGICSVLKNEFDF